MNLRHIDPRSIDWMDAMLDWEREGRPKRERAGTVGAKTDTETLPLVAGHAASPELFGAQPPPGQR